MWCEYTSYAVTFKGLHLATQCIRVLYDHLPQNQIPIRLSNIYILFSVL